MKTIPLILLAVIINTLAQLALKAGMDRIGHFSFSWNNLSGISLQVMTNPFILAGIVCYVTSMLVWLLVLSRVQVGVAYPMISLGYIFTAVAAYYLFGEPLTMLRITGIGVIMLGVYLVARTS
jgi:drug/metabolite transporter (DMT)-like permease